MSKQTEQDNTLKSTSSDGLQELLEKNYELSKKINRKLFLLLLGGYLKWLLILIPLILGIIYLPPLLGNYLTQYQNLLNGIDGMDSGLQLMKNINGGSADINNLLKQIPADKLQEIMKIIGK